MNKIYRSIRNKLIKELKKDLIWEISLAYAKTIGPLEKKFSNFALLLNFECLIQYFFEPLLPNKYTESLEATLAYYYQSSEEIFYRREILQFANFKTLS